MKITKNLISVSLLIIVSTFQTMAQETDTSITGNAFESLQNDNKVRIGPYVSLVAGGGYQTMLYTPDLFSPDYGKRKGGGGFNVTAMFYWYYNHNWGVGAGVGVRSFGSNATVNYMDHFEKAQDAQQIREGKGETYDHRTIYMDLKEKQTFIMLDFPIGMYYQTEMGQKWRFNVGAGPKISAQVYGRAKMAGNHLETHGYYKKFECDLYEMDNHNFMDFDSEKAAAYVKTMISGYLDVNFMWVFKPYWDLVIGTYFDISLNNIRSKQDHLQFDYNTTLYHGLLATSKVDKVHAISTGLRVGVRRYFGVVTKPSIPDPEPEPIPEPIPVPKEPYESVMVDMEIPSIEIDEFFEPVPEPKKKVDLTKELTIGFKFGTAELDYQGDMTVIDDVIQYLQTHPDKKLVVTGHTDNVGSLASNKAIGLKRANAFKSDLIKRGANPSQIECASQGYLEPIAPNDTEENRAKNRRITMLAVDK